MSKFQDDRVSGSAAVALGMLDLMERWLATNTSGSSRALRSDLIEWLRAAQAAQPSMALVHALATRALDVADAAVAREDTPVETRAHLARSCVAEREDLRAAQESSVRTALELVKETGAWIATTSHSSAVREALLAAHAAGRQPRVLASESRPRFEGRTLAAALGAAEIPVWLMADAALPLLVSQARMVWVGADAVTNRGIINKVGTFALALAAREHSVPVYALATRRKFLPAASPALKILEMPPAEIWENPAPGVKPRNVYFELVPLELMRGIVVEDAVIGASEAAALALERRLPVELGGGTA